MSSSRTQELALLRKVIIPTIAGVNGGILKAVLRCIDDHSGGSGECWASLNTLTEESCFSKRSVVRAVNALRESGFVTATERHGRTTSYRVNWSAIAASAKEALVGEVNWCHSGTSAKSELVPPSHSTSASQSQTSAKEAPKAYEAYGSGIQLRALFEKFWEIYPARNGRKLCKADAQKAFLKIPENSMADLMSAVRNYANSDQLPKDAHRWLSHDRWREWIAAADSTAKPNGKVDPAYLPFPSQKVTA